MPRSPAGLTQGVLARVQRLCCLGIGSEMLMPDLVREMRQLVPSRFVNFRWAGPDLEITNFYSERSPPVLGLYMQEFHNRRERDVARVFRENLTCPEPSPVLHWWEHGLKVDRRTLLRSELYNLIFRPVGIDEYLMLRVRESGRIFGMLYLFRGPGDAPYTPRDRKVLELVSGFVAHAMTRAAVANDDFVESDDRGLFVAGPDGRVLHASGRVRALLAMALLPRLSPSAEWDPLRGPVPEIVHLCRTLTATANGEFGQKPPVLHRRTIWGEFVLRAYWLGPTDGAEQTGRIGITIERRVPRALALLRRIEALGLTGREKQLCLLLGCDPSRADLADAMGVTASTVVSYQRSVYAKLGVHSRAGLVTALRAG